MFDGYFSRRRRHSLALSTVCLALLCACRTAEPNTTQIMLIVDADPEVRDLALELTLDVERYSASGVSDGSRLSNSFQVAGSVAVPWPVSFALAPRDGDTGPVYYVSATLFDVAGPIAVLRAQSSFVPRASIEVRLHFSADCLYAASLSCSEYETCEAGSCVDGSIDQRTLASLDPSLNPEGTSTSRPRSGAIKAMGGAAGSGGPSAASNSAAGAGGMSKAPTAGSNGPSDVPKPGSEDGNCGDGRLDTGEKCDAAIAAGAIGACPTECDAAEACQVSQLEGSGCQSECVTYAVTTFESGDGCCPQGADASGDSDCGAVCGNGVVESAETCDPIETCVTPEGCTAANACLRAVIVGDAATCTAACEMQTVEDCVSGDGCCPSDCSSDNDSDCSASCGDGVVDSAAGELCEPQSNTNPCPTDCVDGDPCTRDYLTGAAANCNATCTSVVIVWARSGDGCCPPGANASLDVDCQPLCGNRVVEPGERCDGRCPTDSDCYDGNACTRDALAGAGCSRYCTHTSIVGPAGNDGCCPAGANANNDTDCLPVCGNQVVERGETCDGNCPACSDRDPCTLEINQGTACNPACTHQTVSVAQDDDQCCPRGADASTDNDCVSRTEASCGNGVKEAGETCDPCPTQCVDTNACTRDRLIGTGCNVTCTHEDLNAGPMDGCCPPGANSSTDRDCVPPEPVCGNDKKETGEACDGRDCPSCDDRDACTNDRSVPTPDACHPVCQNTPKTPNSTTQDGCCPPGASSTTDKDCSPPAPECGNGIKEAGEMCDPCPSDCNDDKPCTDDAPTGTGCNVTCTHEPVGPGPADGCCPRGTNMDDDPDCMPR